MARANRHHIPLAITYGKAEMKKLNEALLQPGDIILTTTTAAVSKVIRAAIRSDISHAMVYVDHHSAIDATGDGVHARNTQRLFFEEKCSIHVFRLVNGLSNEQLIKVRNYLRGNIGSQYSTKEAVLTALGGARESSRKQFCSRLVAQAFGFAGINLVDNPHYCSPADLKASHLLVEVLDITRPVGAEEIVFWDEIENIPQMMQEAINTVLDGARAKNKEIQTFDDLHRHLVEHPEDDDYLCQLLDLSGYLSIWNIEKDKNPWQYDLELMHARPVAATEDYCWNVFAHEDAGLNRYVINRGGYALFSKQFDLRFFKVMLNLYELLATLHRTRVEVAVRWLEANHRLDPIAEKTPLRPHTAEWFTALEIWDPPKAAMTRKVIELAENVNVCSICGDDPASDYRLEEAHRPASGVDTLRLCVDCLAIRKLHGDSFALLPNASK